MKQNAQMMAEMSASLEAPVPDGTVREHNGKRCICYDGYWIRHYDVPANEDVARRELIDQLTKRVFHHTEPGINTPGYKLKDAREAYDRQTEPHRRRVNAAMLAGALLNRGSTSSIFSSSCVNAVSRSTTTTNCCANASRASSKPSISASRSCTTVARKGWTSCGGSR